MCDTEPQVTPPPKKVPVFVRQIQPGLPPLCSKVQRCRKPGPRGVPPVTRDEQIARDAVRLPIFPFGIRLC
ncbi:complement C1s subcomponent [Prionailurus iriomotensis]